jgi:DNA-binding winged helix-turn-helix (wHTH) protein/TolB-like protein/tetratricopeptide (TPR) repeat protein
MPTPFQGPYVFDDYHLDPRERLLLLAAERVPLSPRAFDLLVALVGRAGHLVTKEDLLQEVWRGTFVEEANLSYTVSLVRKALNDEAQPHRYVETVPKRGYRFIAPVKAPAALGGCEQVPARRRLGAGTWLVVAGVALVAGLVSWRAWEGAGGEPPATVRTLVVLPLRTADAAQQSIADAIAEGLTGEFVRLEGLDGVIAFASAAKYRGSTAPPAAIARELDVDAALTGSVIRAGDRVLVHVELVRASDQRTLWSDTYTSGLDDVWHVQRQIVRAAVRQVRVAVSDGERARLLERPRAIPALAVDWVHKARAVRMRNPAEAQAALEQALAIDPAFADAWADLALVLIYRAYGHSLQSVIPRARAAAEEALRLDPHHAAARVALGRIRLHVDWDWDGAGREFQAAIAQQPNSFDARWNHAFYLGTLGRFDEAIAEDRRAVALNPAVAAAHFNLAFNLRLAGHYGAAITAMNRAVELEPENTYLLRQRAFTYALNNDCARALADFDAASRRQRERGPLLGYALARCGLRTRAEEIAAEERRAGRCLAGVYAGLGNRDEAFACLEEMYARRAFELVQVPTQPWFAGLHLEPRFQLLLHRIGYPRP